MPCLASPSADRPVRGEHRLAGVDVGRRQPDFLFEIYLHDRHETLLIWLLVDLHLDVAGLHLLDHLRSQIEAAEQDLAGRDVAVLQQARDVGMPQARLDIGGGVRMGADIGADAIGDDCAVALTSRRSIMTSRSGLAFLNSSSPFIMPLARCSDQFWPGALTPTRTRIGPVLRE